MYKVLKHMCFAFELIAMKATPARRVTHLHGELSSWLTGLPYLADQATRLHGSPHLSCKGDQEKKRNDTDRPVTPPGRVNSPTWGPPPSCKQALS